MIKVMFVCHGNICRSPMAEFIFKHMIKTIGVENDFYVESSATSREEIGNDIYPPAKKKLREEGIAFSKRTARQFQQKDYENFDYIFVMERYNYVNLCKIIHSDKNNKIHMMTEYTDLGADIADPWYSGDFNEAYSQIYESCKAFLDYLEYDVQKL